MSEGGRGLVGVNGKKSYPGGIRKDEKEEGGGDEEDSKTKADSFPRKNCLVKTFVEGMYVKESRFLTEFHLSRFHPGPL